MNENVMMFLFLLFFLAIVVIIFNVSNSDLEYLAFCESKAPSWAVKTNSSFIEGTCTYLNGGDIRDGTLDIQTFYGMKDKNKLGLRIKMYQD